ncbi:MAG: IPT/TIG domain-containing protein [Caldilineaceae bacterium]
MGRFSPLRMRHRAELTLVMLSLLLTLSIMITKSTVTQAQTNQAPDSVRQLKERWWAPPPIQTSTTAPLAPVVTSEARRRDDWVRMVVQTFNESDTEIALVENEFIRQPRKLTDNAAADLFPRLNTGATEVVFASDRDGNFEIYRVNVDGSNTARLTTDPLTDTMPIWSPDGQQILFVSTRTGNADLFTMQRDGSQVVQLTSDSADDLYPHWSPVGDRLTWVRRNGSQRTLWVANADGSNAHALTGALPFLAHPVWSPNGERIAFDYDASGDGWNDIAVINADGSGLTTLAALRPQEELWMGSWYTDDPNFGRGERLLVSKLEYYFNAAGMLTALMGFTQKLYPCCQILEGPEIAALGQELLPDAQRSDLWAPSSTILPLSKYTRAVAVPVRWQGSDQGPAGIAYFDVQYRPQGSATWQGWRDQTIEDAALFSDAPGQRVAFRVRAVDHAEHWEAWPTGNDGDAATTLYQWELTGEVTDNRGIPVPQTPLSISPAPLEGVQTERTGRYVALLTSSGAYQIEDGQSEMVDNDWLANRYQRPADATLITTSLTLGQNCVGICLAPVTGADPHWQTNGSSLVFALTTGSDNAVHLLWADHATRQLSYQRRNSSGGWHPAELITAGSDPQWAAVLAVDQAQTVHVAWSTYSSPNGFMQSVIYYAQRPQNGGWTAPVLVGTGEAPMAMQVDARGGVHLLYGCSSSTCQSGLYYQERLPTGQWQSALKVDEWQEQHGLTMHVNADGALQLAWLGTINPNNMGANTHQAVLQKSRSAAGNWSPTRTGFTGYDLQAGQLGFDRLGQLYLLWTEQSWDANGVTFANREEAPGRWSEPQALLRRAYDYSYALLVDAANTWHLLATPPSFQATIPLYRYQPTGGAWSNPQPLYGQGANFQVMQSTLSPQGQMHLLVQDNQNSYRYRTTQLATQPVTFTQQVAISVPLTLRNPTLTFFYDLAGPGVASAFAVTLQPPDATGNGGATPRLSTAQRGAQQLAWLDLTPWAGQSVTATFTLQQAANEPYLHATIHDLTVGSWTTPVISTVVPARVSAGSATRLTLTGQNFLTLPTLLAGNTPLVDLTLVDDTQLEATIPATVAPGIYDLWINIGEQRTVRPSALAVGEQIYLPLIQQ